MRHSGSLYVRDMKYRSGVVGSWLELVTMYWKIPMRPSRVTRRVSGFNVMPCFFKKRHSASYTGFLGFLCESTNALCLPLEILNGNRLLLKWLPVTCSAISQSRSCWDVFLLFLPVWARSAEQRRLRVLNASTFFLDASVLPMR